MTLQGTSWTMKPEELERLDPGRVYRGFRNPLAGTVDVTVAGHALPLDPSRELRDHSPTGFEWGYGGSGPAQLALAILLDFLGDHESALGLYQAFKFDVIANLPRDRFTLTGEEIIRSLYRIHAFANPSGEVPRER